MIAPQFLLDNTVLSNFALVRQTQLLRDSLSYRAATVAEVMSEYQNGVALGKMPRTDWEWLLVYELTVDERGLCQTLRRRLSAGEAACLAAAHTRKMSVMTDDRDARQIAIQYGIPLSGTIGILVGAVRTQILDREQANRILQDMMRFGYRSPVAKLDSLL